MKDEREDPRTKRSPDSRIEYSQGAQEDEPEPAPYDLAPPGTLENQIIRKGERERPGPTDDDQGGDDAYDREDSRTARSDDVSQDDLEPRGSD